MKSSATSWRFFRIPGVRASTDQDIQGQYCFPHAGAGALDGRRHERSRYHSLAAQSPTVDVETGPFRPEF